MRIEAQDQGLKHTILATDIVVFTLIDSILNVLLVKVRKEHFKGLWAVPGGLVRLSETVDECAERNLLKTIRSDDFYLEQLYTFGKIDRDPHGRVVSVTYIALASHADAKRETSEEYDAIDWFPATNLPKLAYDHDEAALFALDRLRSKITYSNIVFGLLPDEFTLSKLQTAYESILNKKLDKRNFRKKIASLKLLDKTGNKTKGLAHRPASLYRFKDKQLVTAQIL